MNHIRSTAEHNANRLRLAPVALMLSLGILTAACAPQEDDGRTGGVVIGRIDTNQADVQAGQTPNSGQGTTVSSIDVTTPEGVITAQESPSASAASDTVSATEPQTTVSTETTLSGSEMMALDEMLSKVLPDNTATPLHPFDYGPGDSHRITVDGVLDPRERKFICALDEVLEIRTGTPAPDRDASQGQLEYLSQALTIPKSEVQGDEVYLVPKCGAQIILRYTYGPQAIVGAVDTDTQTATAILGNG